MSGPRADGVFSDERMVDLLVTAIEGGVGYWARAYEYRHSGENPHAIIVDFEPALDAIDSDTWQDGWSRLDEAYENRDERVLAHEYHVDLPLLRATVKSALVGEYGKNGVHYAAQFVNEDEDAITADVLVQLATLGELTYG